MKSMTHTTRNRLQTLYKVQQAESNIDMEVHKVKNIILQSLMLILLATVLLTGCDSNDKPAAVIDPVTITNTNNEDLLKYSIFM